MINLVAEAIVSEGIIHHRAMTEEELLADEQNRLAAAKQEADQAEAKLAESTAKAALLAKLGITEDEAKLLLS